MRPRRQELRPIITSRQGVVFSGTVGCSLDGGKTGERTSLILSCTTLPTPFKSPSLSNLLTPSNLQFMVLTVKWLTISEEFMLRNA